MKGVPEAVVLGCCVLAVLVSVTIWNPPHPRLGEREFSAADRYAWWASRVDASERPPGLMEDLTRIGPLVWLYAALAGALAVAAARLRARWAFRIALFAVLAGATAVVLETAEFTRLLDGAWRWRFDVTYPAVGRALANLRIASGLAAVALLVRIVLPIVARRGKEAS